MSNPEQNEKQAKMSEKDYEFLIRTKLFDAVSEEARFQLLVSMKPEHVPKGERFIRQGEAGDRLYLIQRGHCAVVLEKNEILHPVAVLGPGDLVGEMAILTGENRNAHVEAQSDMDLWRLNRVAFEKLCSQYQEIRHFLTQLVAVRFGRSTIIADRTVGKYVIQEVLGRGGWSIVYKGMHVNLSMPVAVKMLKHDMAMDDDFLARFENEARTIAHLNHENIVKVYDIEQLYRTVFIVMEYLDGKSLYEILLDEHKLQPQRALDIILQVCAGLGYAHDQGVIHGDVKPANIFIQEGDRAKILDFGLACPEGTRSKRIVGTPKYFSPEAIRLGPVDARSDIYSLGVASYRILTGQEAFQSPDIANLCHMHLYEPTPDPAALVPDLPEELRTFILKAGMKNPADRFQNMAETIHHLQPLSRRLGVELPAQSTKNFNMKSLFLFYRDEHQGMIGRLVTDFTRELEKIGAVMKEADFKDI